MEKFESLEGYVEYLDLDKDCAIVCEKDAFGNVLRSWKYHKRPEQLTDLKNQLLFDILQTLIEINDKLENKEQKNE